MSDFGLQLDLFEPDDLGERTGVPAPTMVRLVTSDDGFAALLRELEVAERVAFDTETTGIDMTRCGLVGISVCIRAGEGWYLPVAPGGTLSTGMSERWLMRAPHLEQLRQALGAHCVKRPAGIGSASLVAHNAKFDLGVLKRHGVEVACPVFDTLIAQFAVDPFLHRSGGYGLKALAKRYFGWAMVEFETLMARTPSGRGAFGRRGHAEQISIQDVPIELVASYAVADADATWRLADVLGPQIDALKLDRLLNDVEFPLVPVLVDMELAGVAIDLPYLAQLSSQMHVRQRSLEDQIHRMAGRIFNVGSPQQLSAVLYGLLGLQVNFSDVDALNAQGRTPSTRAYRLESVQDKHPIVPLVLEHRELTKLLGTYVDALPELVNPDTGRVHTHFNQSVVITGRLSSSNPNLQNVPITTEIGRQVRQAFIARQGAEVVSADYSQIELRVLAHLANDSGLKAAFGHDEDIHGTTAAAIYGVSLSAVTTTQRGFAKKINYGIAYGMSAYSLGRGTGMSDADAERFMAEYFKRFAGVKRWLDGTKRKMKVEGYVDTLYGRRRPFESMQGKLSGDVRRAERLAVNHPVQGTAAEIVKLAMIGLSRSLKTGGYRTQLTLQVHDELVLDAPDDEVADVRQLLRREMETAVALTVPLKADVGVGRNWDLVA